MEVATRMCRTLAALALLLMLSMAVTQPVTAVAFKNVQVHVLDENRESVDCGTFRIAEVSGETAPLSLPVTDGKVEASIAPGHYLVAVQSCQGDFLLNILPATVTDDNIIIYDSFWQVPGDRDGDEFVINSASSIELSQVYEETFVLPEPTDEELREQFNLNPEGLAKAVLLVSGEAEDPNDFNCVIPRNDDGTMVTFRFSAGHQVAARGDNLVGYYTTTEPYVTQAIRCETVEGKFFRNHPGTGMTERYIDFECRNIIVPPNVEVPKLPPPPEVTPPPTVVITPPPPTETPTPTETPPTETPTPTETPPTETPTPTETPCDCETPTTPEPTPDLEVTPTPEFEETPEPTEEPTEEPCDCETPTTPEPTPDLEVTPTPETWGSESNDAMSITSDQPEEQSVAEDPYVEPVVEEVIVEDPPAEQIVQEQSVAEDPYVEPVVEDPPALVVEESADEEPYLEPDSEEAEGSMMVLGWILGGSTVVVAGGAVVTKPGRRKLKQLLPGRKAHALPAPNRRQELPPGEMK